MWMRVQAGCVVACEELYNHDRESVSVIVFVSRALVGLDRFVSNQGLTRDTVVEMECVCVCASVAKLVFTSS